MCTTISDLSRESYQCVTTLNTSLLFPIHRALTIRVWIKFRLLMWQDDVWLDKNASRYSCSATHKNIYTVLALHTDVLSVTMWHCEDHHIIFDLKHDLTWPNLCWNLIIPQHWLFINELRFFIFFFNFVIPSLYVSIWSNTSCLKTSPYHIFF